MVLGCSANKIQKSKSQLHFIEINLNHNYTFNFGESKMSFFDKEQTDFGRFSNNIRLEQHVSKLFLYRACDYMSDYRVFCLIPCQILLVSVFFRYCSLIRFQVALNIIIDNLFGQMNQYEQNLFTFYHHDQSSQFEPFRLQDNSIFHYQFNFGLTTKNQALQEFSRPSLKWGQTTKNTKITRTQSEEKVFQNRGNTEIDCSPLVRLNIQKTVQGTKDGTVQLNINFKTIIVNFFKELMLLNQLNNEQVQLVQDFISRSPSFKSFAQFCRSGSQKSNIRQRLLQLIESKDIMCKIMSSRCRFQNKLQMIKFVEVLRKNVKSEDGIIKWKQLLRK